jgi:protein phosphatase
VGQYSHPGRKRARNEDWLGAFQPESPKRLATKGSLFLVADGMGGHRSGEIASRRAVDQVIRAYMHDPTSDVAASLHRAIRSANASLYETAASEQTGARWGTTLVAAVVRRDELWVANVGDSRAYLLRDRQLQRLSRDHSWGGEAAVAMGENWIGRHVITRALGSRPEIEVDVYPPRNLRPGDRIILCTDGLTGPLDEGAIGEIVRRYPPQRAAEQLVRAANERDAPDNVSVIVVNISGVWGWDLERQASQSGSSRAGMLFHLVGRGKFGALRQAIAQDRQLLVILVLALLVAAIVLVGLGFAAGLVFWGG